MQLEARQLADAERDVSSELAKAGPGEAGKDAVRRLAGEQERLADRTRRLNDALKQQAGRGGRSGSDGRAQGRGADGDNANAQAQTAAEASRDLERQRIAERMQQSADAMRAAAERAPGAQRGTTAQGPESGETKAQVSAQDDIARELDKLADKLGSANGTGAQDGESRKLSDQLARVQAQRDKLDALGREMAKLGRQNGQSANGSRGSSAQKSPGQTGRTGEGQQGGGGGSGTDAARLQDQYKRQLQETRDLLNQLGREDPAYSQGGGGLTFEGRGMTMSAPGTEAFKQDFAKWEDLKRQATQALENVESSISKKLQAKQARDRLAAGTDDTAPPEYKKQVDSYFKAIAGKKKP
jgi:hypothetical protein